MIEAYRLAQHVHAKLCADVANAQRDLVMLDLLESKFGPDALPQAELLRGFSDVLATAAERNHRYAETLEKSVEEKLESIRELEHLFSEKNDADLKSFADYLRERMGATQ